MSASLVTRITIGITAAVASVGILVACGTPAQEDALNACQDLGSVWTGNRAIVAQIEASLPINWPELEEAMAHSSDAADAYMAAGCG